MNILFFMNHYPDSRNGGIENVTRMLSDRFIGQGWHIHVAYLFESAFDHSNDTPFDRCEQVPIHEFMDTIRSWIIEHKIEIIINRCVIFISPFLRKVIHGVDCKLITTYNNKPTLTPPVLQEIYKNKDVSRLQKLIITLIYPLFYRRSVMKLRKKHQCSYKSSDITVLLSHNYISEYSEMMRIGTKKLVVRNNPIRSGLQLTIEEFQKKEKIVLMVTRLDETQKCVIKALRIWKKIRPIYSEWKFMIVGSGPDESRIKEYAQELFLQNTEFIPACNPIEYYKKASIFLMTSRNEGWPNTLNEAMRLGCVPVVIATFSAVFDMIDDGKEGLLIQPKNEKTDIQRCTDALNSLIKNDLLRQSMAHNAIRKTERLSIESIVKDWSELLETLINKH